MPQARQTSPRPRKSLGQHFLRDETVIHDIVAAVRVPAGGFVLEIGPGTGQLTAELLAVGHEVVAVEVENRMVEYLGRRFEGNERLRVVEADARLADLAEVVPGSRPFAMAANLPYFAANPIIRHVLEGERRPTEMVVMVQREVGREICAADGDFSLLTIGVRVYAAVEHLFDVPPHAFTPPPKVFSSVLRLTVRDEPLIPRDDLARFFTLVRATFRNPRKQIHNALAQGTWLPPGGSAVALEAAGVDPMRRPETLTVDEWRHLMDACAEVVASA
ncbi:MAG: 16S rRNA (adenine(1518)-N(6)/adenine(1519)-N(6))-dimethyltransferase RsmA [Tepidiformaceae bacterium]